MMANKLYWPAIGALALLWTAEADAQPPKPPAPKEFAAAMSQSDQYEIFAAKVALVESHDPRVRAFADTMIKDHTKTSQELQKAAAASGLPPPDPGMNGDQARLLESLQSVASPDFDKLYSKQQSLAHTQAVTVDETFANTGSDANLQATARSALPILREHLKMAQQLVTEVGGS
jgi:putative membrane protein